MIPSFLIKPLSILGLIVVVFVSGWLHGSNSASKKYEEQAAALRLQAAERSVKVVTKYVDRVKVVREKGETIIQEVPIYVPTTAPDLPGGFRLLHNATVSGQVPDPTGIADAPAVSAQDATRTVIDNYTTCHLNSEQLIALQDWLREVNK
jgi:hypothetical protein